MNNQKFLISLQIRYFLNITCFLITILLAACISIGAQEHMSHQEHMSPKEGMPMEHMAMYKASLLSGCNDYHCLKCKSRDYCSMGNNCGMPECGHEHAVVECHGSSVLYLRSANGFLSCMDRAKKVVNAMNSVMTLENPERWRYVVKDKISDPEIWLEMEGMPHGNKIVTVTSADLGGYHYRAKITRMSYPAEAIDKRLVARWWAAILQDHYDAMILGKRPSLSVETHCGKPLLKAFDAARERVPNGSISMKVWNDVFSQDLSPTDRDRLGLAAQIIPKGFIP